MINQVSRNVCFGGEQLRYQHQSAVLNCPMHFSLFLPEQATERPVPLLIWLSGLTCTDENFVLKAGAQREASRQGIAILAPDTSPRGDSVADDPDYDLGQGAGFYVNATQPPWSAHYQMYDYLCHELPQLLSELPVDLTRIAISGHSMGGHGALVIALRQGLPVRSVSAFSPICAPLQCPWGQKALAAYLGEERSLWQDYDASHLLSHGGAVIPMLIDQGDADDFLSEQLHPETLQRCADEAGYPLTLRMQPGYDHSYFFIASFIGEHIRFHAQHLLGLERLSL